MIERVSVVVWRHTYYYCEPTWEETERGFQAGRHEATVRFRVVQVAVGVPLSVSGVLCVRVHRQDTRVWFTDPIRCDIYINTIRVEHVVEQVLVVHQL